MKFNPYVIYGPKSQPKPYKAQNSPYRTRWKLDEDVEFKGEYAEFEYLMKLTSGLVDKRIWLYGAFDESVPQIQKQEIDHQDILDLLET